MSWFKRLLGLDAVQGECVPRAMFNAMAWSIKHKTPVFIADVKGHWQACGQNEDGELIFLEGNGWHVWEGKKEGTNPIYKLWNLQDAMDHFVRHNLWCMPDPAEKMRLDQKVKDVFGTEPKEVE